MAKTVEPTDISSLMPTQDARLTLTTCTPKYSARYRLNVQSVLVKIAARNKPTLLRRLMQRLAPEPKSQPLPKGLLGMALSEARSAVAAHPKSGEAHVGLGIVYRNMGKNFEAEQEFKQAVSLENSAQGHYYLGLLYDAQGNRDTAVTELRAAVSLNMNFEDAYYALGNIHLARRDYPSAIDALGKAVAASPVSADSHYFLGVAYERAGNRELAIQQYVEAIRYVSDYAEAREGLRRLGVAVDDLQLEPFQ